MQANIYKANINLEMLILLPPALPAEENLGHISKLNVLSFQQDMRIHAILMHKNTKLSKEENSATRSKICYQHLGLT